MNPTPEPEARVLVVDDESMNLRLLQRMLHRAGYRHIEAVADPVEALELVSTFQPDIVLLDLHMPKLDGYGVLARLVQQVPEDEFLPVVVLTGDMSGQARERALSLGAHDFLNKPFDVTEVLLRIRNLLATRSLHDRVRRQNELLEERVRERTDQLEQARLDLLYRLGLAAEYRDDATHAHTQRVGANAARLGLALGMGEAEAGILGLAAPLHDIGKIGISDTVLLSPQRLTDSEFEQVKLHTLIGARLLMNSTTEVLEAGKEIALGHHEHWDGTGYPQGLRGEDIPFSSRLVAVVDVFDALTHERPYKPAWTVEEAVKGMQADRNRHFDPDVLDAFLDLVADGEIRVS